MRRPGRLQWLLIILRPLPLHCCSNPPTSTCWTSRSAQAGEDFRFAATALAQPPFQFELCYACTAGAAGTQEMQPAIRRTDCTTLLFARLLPSVSQACGHEGGRAGKIKWHSSRNLCHCCPPTEVRPANTHGSCAGSSARRELPGCALRSCRQGGRVGMRTSAGEHEQARLCCS